MLRALTYSVASVALLTLFGCEVCPYIESLGRATLGTLFAVFFAIALIVRAPLERRWVLGASPFLQPRRQFHLDLGLYAAVGLALTAFDQIAYGFPVTSGTKALLGALTIGLFFAADSALARERAVARQLVDAGNTITVPEQTFSLTRKFLVMAVGILVLIAADVAFLTLKDLNDADRQPDRLNVRREVLTEIVWVVAFFVPLTVNLVFGFARNLRLFLENQRQALHEVAQGKLAVRVPIASADEFATIARYTNQMIEGLAERERIRDLFGKLVSPAIGKRLIDAGGLQLGGSRRRVVVLFSDVRNFTSRTEHADPEAVVEDLNRYFARMVEVVHAHNGVVDKFIGDGMMAIFGLEEFEAGVLDGVRAAKQMLAELEKVNLELSEPFRIGVGLHAGDVVAGTIGSPHRLEFTFVGDTVNVAARIEGLTKELGTSLLISEAIKTMLRDEPALWAWRPCGDQTVKGRKAKVRVYSLASADGAVAARADGDAEDSFPESFELEQQIQCASSKCGSPTLLVARALVDGPGAGL